ncbi:MAG: hypothetical protein ACEPO8_06540 [Rhodothermaceae bacterium]
MSEKLNIISFYSDFMSKEEADRIGQPFIDTFADVKINGLQNDLNACFIVSGGTEQKTIAHLTEHHNNEFPVLLIAHPGNNSLPASLEILAKLNLQGNKGKIIFCPEPGNQDAVEDFNSAITEIALNKKLSNSNIGLIGKPSDWLIASMPEQKEILKNWGINIVEIDIEELRTLVNESDLGDYSSLTDDFKSNSCNILEPTEKEIEDGMKVYAGLKKLAEKYNLAALTIRCFDLVIKDKTTGCYALSKLTDDGIIAGCEGDIPSVVGMYWSYLLTGQTPWMANPSSIDVKNSTMKLAHCTVPRKIINSYDIRSHFESGLGIAIQGEIKEGAVTLIRLGGKELKSVWTAEGNLLLKKNQENLCRTQVEILVNDSNKLKQLLSNPLGNHIVMIHGWHSERLLEWHNEFVK